MADHEPPPSPVHAFADRAWEQFLELDPLWATLQGDERWDDRLDDPGPDGRAALMAVIDGWGSEAARLDGPELSVDDRITLGLVHFVARRFRGSHELRLWEMEGIDQYNGPQGLVGDLARLQRADSPQRFERLLDRLEAYPDWNPFILTVDGEAFEGDRLRVTMRPPGGMPMVIRPTVLLVEEPFELRWKGRRWAISRLSA